VKIDERAQRALQQPDSRAVTVELTPELKAKYSRISEQVCTLLRANTDGPMEAYMILHFVVQGFEDTYGIRGGFALGKEHED
jgi:hypothetical protein